MRRGVYSPSPEEGARHAYDAQVSIPVEAGNAAARTGNSGSTIKGILDDLTPEAAYFSQTTGSNRIYLLDMRIPRNCPPLRNFVSRLQRPT